MQADLDRTGDVEDDDGPHSRSVGIQEGGVMRLERRLDRINMRCTGGVHARWKRLADLLGIPSVAATIRFAMDELDRSVHQEVLEVDEKRLAYTRGRYTRLVDGTEER